MEMDMEMEMGVHKLTREIVRQQHRRQREDTRQRRNEIEIVLYHYIKRKRGREEERWSGQEVGDFEPRDVD